MDDAASDSIAMPPETPDSVGDPTLLNVNVEPWAETAMPASSALLSMLDEDE